MTIPKEITQYINRTRQTKMPDRLIRQELIKLGYNVSDIDAALKKSTHYFTFLHGSTLKRDIVSNDRSYLIPTIFFIICFSVFIYFGYVAGALYVEDFFLGVFIISLIATAVVAIVVAVVHKIFGGK